VKGDDPVHESWRALRESRWEDVLACVARVPDDAPSEVRARAEAWRAQALRALGRVQEAADAVRDAVRHARVAGDAEGVRVLRALQEGIHASLAAARVAEAGRAEDRILLDLDDAALLAGASEDTERVARCIKRAQAQLDAGRLEAAEASLALGTRHASPDDLRGRVLLDLAAARLANARGNPDEVRARVLAAHALADAHDDMNLVTAVAHAARAAGIVLRPPPFATS
jgi:hypothetical protein